MAPVAVVDREGYIEMTATAEPALQNLSHAKILSPLFLDVEHFRVAHITAHPVKMRFVREVCRRDHPDLGCQFDRPVKIHDRWLFLQISTWGYEPSLERLRPVNSISVFGRWEWFFSEIDKLVFDEGIVVIVTFDAVLSMTEGGCAVMASSTITAILQLFMAYLGTVDFHPELKLSMAHFTGVPQSMCPVRECRRQHFLFL